MTLLYWYIDMLTSVFNFLANLFVILLVLIIASQINKTLATIILFYSLIYYLHEKIPKMVIFIIAIFGIFFIVITTFRVFTGDETLFRLISGVLVFWPFILIIFLNIREQGFSPLPRDIEFPDFDWPRVTTRPRYIDSYRAKQNAFNYSKSRWPMKYGFEHDEYADENWQNFG